MLARAETSGGVVGSDQGSSLRVRVADLRIKSKTRGKTGRHGRVLSNFRFCLLRVGEVRGGHDSVLKSLRPERERERERDECVWVRGGDNNGEG